MVEKAFTRVETNKQVYLRRQVKENRLKHCADLILCGGNISTDIFYQVGALTLNVTVIGGMLIKKKTNNLKN